MSSKLVKGTFLLAFATMFCRLLGLIYYFPFMWLVGLQGAALYAYAYNPYTVMISISTMGLPLAISKFVARHNALNDYHTGFRLFKSALLILTATGLLSCYALWFFAESLARQFIGDGAINGQGNRLTDTVLVIKTVSLALILVPLLSLFRGYFQGFQMMLPTAVSQVIEQFIRVAFILSSAFIIIKINQGSITEAVLYAVFAAFVAAAAGILSLLFYWLKGWPELQQTLSASKPSQLALSAIYKELLTYAIPFILVGLAIPIFLMIDTMTINQTLLKMGYSLADAEDIFSMINQTVHKIIMLPVALATALAITTIPVITDAYTQVDQSKLMTKINQAFKLLVFMITPAVIGLVILAKPIYGSLYMLHNMHQGGNILMVYAPTAGLFAFFTLTSAMLQGINQQKMALFSLALAVLIKYELNSIFIQYFHEYGAIICSDIGYGLAIIINIIVIQHHFKEPAPLFRNCLPIVYISLIMGAIIFIFNAFLMAFFPSTVYLHILIKMLVCLCLGIVTYLLMAYRLGITEDILGNRFKFRKGSL